MDGYETVTQLHPSETSSCCVFLCIEKVLKIVSASRGVIPTLEFSTMDLSGTRPCSISMGPSIYASLRARQRTQSGQYDQRVGPASRVPSLPLSAIHFMGVRLL